MVFTSLGEAVKYRGKKIAIFPGDAYFRHSQIGNLGQLRSIGGHVNFQNSQVKDLGQLWSIGGNASFRYSQVENLGQLRSIGGNADFSQSRIKDLNQLEVVGGYFFADNGGLLKTAFPRFHVVLGSSWYNS